MAAGGGWEESGEGRVSGGGAGTSLRGRFHTLSRPRVPTRLASLTLPLPGLPARPLLSLHLRPVSAPLSRSLLAFPSSVLLPPPGPGSESPPRLQPRRADRSPVEPEPGAGGWHERSSTKGAPVEMALESAEAQGPALLPPAASPTCLQLTSAPRLPPPYLPELLKFATCSHSRRGKSAGSSRTHLPAAHAGAGFPAALGSRRCRPR